MTKIFLKAEKKFSFLHVNNTSYSERKHDTWSVIDIVRCLANNHSSLFSFLIEFWLLTGVLYQGRLILLHFQRVYPDWSKMAIMVPFPLKWLIQAFVRFQGKFAGKEVERMSSLFKKGTRERPSIISYNHLATSRRASLKTANILRKAQQENGENPGPQWCGDTE